MSRTVFRSGWTWAIVLLLFGAGQVAHRVPPVRHDAFFFDFSNVYSASRAWIEGQNPYRMPNVYRAWESSNHGHYLGSSDPAAMHRWAAVYPPSSLLLIAPIAALSAVPGHLLWVSLGIALLLASFFALFELAGIHDRRSRFLFIACALASAPVQSAIESGQLALPAAALVILAVWAFAKDRLTFAAILLGAAAIMKIQIGGPFILYYFFIRQWRIASLAGIFFTFATVATLARMEAAGVGTWWADWHRNIANTLEVGQINDPRPFGPFRNDMVNLQTLVDVVLRSQFEINLGVLILFLPLMAGFASRVRPIRAAGYDLVALSLVALLSMLPLYHRLYDGVLLLMLLAWAISRLQTERRQMAIAILVLLSEFLVPNDLLPSILRRTHAFDSMAATMWWQGLIVPHHAWAMLTLTAGTLYVFAYRGRPVVTAPALAADCDEVEVSAHSA